MGERFAVDHAYPSWPVNRWISAMFKLFRRHIEALLLGARLALLRPTATLGRLHRRGRLVGRAFACLNLGAGAVQMSHDRLAQIRVDDRRMHPLGPAVGGKLLVSVAGK